MEHLSKFSNHKNRWLLPRVKTRLHISSTSPLFVIFNLFDVVCKQDHSTVLTPFLNGTKIGDVDGTCKRNLTENKNIPVV